MGPRVVPRNPEEKADVRNWLDLDRHCRAAPAGSHIDIWAIVSNRRRSRKERERSEEATRELYQRIDREES
jgi:hypothetical protein